MRLRLIFDAQFCGREEKIVDVDESITEDEIKLLFQKYFGISYDDNCYWEKVE